jgi:hypothetical protein
MLLVVYCLVNITTPEAGNQQLHFATPILSLALSVNDAAAEKSYGAEWDQPAACA